MNITCVVDAKNKLGEVPVWDEREQALYWVDIEGKLLQRYQPATGDVKRWTMPERIACFALREQGGLIVAFASGFAFYDLDSGRIDWIAKPKSHIPTNRFNEGKCDRKGRFWAGTMDDRLKEHTGALYRVDLDLSVHKVVDGIGISNSTVWSSPTTPSFSPTRSTARSSASTTITTPAPSPIAARSSISRGAGLESGRLDHRYGGLSVECAMGRLAAGALRARRPSHRIVELPVQKPTSCMFGGKDLKTLYVTSAVWDLTPEDLVKQPQAGGLFALDFGVGGVPEPRFAG